MNVKVTYECRCVLHCNQVYGSAASDDNIRALLADAASHKCPIHGKEMDSIIKEFD